jgi:diguanylate cyclase (GGDEF)-like protein
LGEEYVETGSFSNLMVHLSAEMPLHHVVMMMVIPLMMILGFLFIRQGNLKEKMRVMSITDELTGLHNRRGFFTLAYQQLKIAKRLNRETLLLSADMDNLKEINDTLGHKEGDRALIDTASILRKTFRESDIIARIGGDEFMVLQIESNDGGSGMVTDRLKKNLEIHNAKNEKNFNLSLSVGTVYYDPEVHHSLDELLVCVDKLMYEQKKHKKKS